MKLVCKQALVQLLGHAADMPKIRRLLPDEKGFTASDCRAILAALHFILAQATRARVQSDRLEAELLQLGFPRENASGVSRPFAANHAALLAGAEANTLSHPVVIHTDVRPQYFVANSITTQPVKWALLQAQVTHEPGTRRPAFTAEQLGYRVRLSARKAEESDLRDGGVDVKDWVARASKALGGDAPQASPVLSWALTPEMLGSLTSSLQRAIQAAEGVPSATS